MNVILEKYFPHLNWNEKKINFFHCNYSFCLIFFNLSFHLCVSNRAVYRRNCSKQMFQQCQNLSCENYFKRQNGIG